MSTKARASPKFMKIKINYSRLKLSYFHVLSAEQHKDLPFGYQFFDNSSFRTFCLQNNSKIFARDINVLLLQKVDFEKFFWNWDYREAMAPWPQTVYEPLAKK